MKKILLNIIFSLTILLGINGSAYAVNVFQPCSGGAANTTVCQEASKNQNGKNPVISAVKVVLNVMSIVAGFLAVIMIIIAGLRLVTGGGDANTYNTARGSIIYAAIGIFVVVLSQTIVVFVLNRIK